MLRELGPLLLSVDSLGDTRCAVHAVVVRSACCEQQLAVGLLGLEGQSVGIRGGGGRPLVALHRVGWSMRSRWLGGTLGGGWVFGADGCREEREGLNESGHDDFEEAKDKYDPTAIAASVPVWDEAAEAAYQQQNQGKPL